MTPELRSHVDAFAADCAADLVYIGKRRYTPTSNFLTFAKLLILQ